MNYTNNLLGTTPWILINSGNLVKEEAYIPFETPSVNPWSKLFVLHKDKPLKIDISKSVMFEISERNVSGKTNRFAELQIYSLLRAHSSVDFENTRWKCATYGVKWEAERGLFRRNL